MKKLSDQEVNNLAKAITELKDPFAQPKKEWVGLTDAERELAAWSSSDFLKMAESIEAKLREKNG